MNERSEDEKCDNVLPLISPTTGFNNVRIGPPEYYLRIDGGLPGTPGFFIFLAQVPNRFHRFMMRLLLGWRVTRGVDSRVGEVVKFGRSHVDER